MSEIVSIQLYFEVLSTRNIWAKFDLHLIDDRFQICLVAHFVQLVVKEQGLNVYKLAWDFVLFESY